MNDITVTVYLVLFASVVGATFAFMWKMMGSTLAAFDKTSVNSYSDAMRAYKPHPEEPKDGEEVMGVTFKSCDLEDYDKLQSRIDDLKKKLENE